MQIKMWRDLMENTKTDNNRNNIERNVHKSRCIECPAYNECMGVWLDYFAGNRMK